MAESNIILLLLAALAVRLLAGQFDRFRIRNYLRRRGARQITIIWAPFGKGWFGNNGARIYSVKYVNSGGGYCQTYVKTSLFGGVYFSDV